MNGAPFAFVLGLLIGLELTFFIIIAHATKASFTVGFNVAARAATSAIDRATSASAVRARSRGEG